MEVEMTREIGSRVYLMKDDKVVYGTIIGAMYHKYMSPADLETVVEHESYEVKVRVGDDNSCRKWYNSEYLFTTKEELIDSL